MVLPSGDRTGVRDVSTLQSALYYVKDVSGGTVLLSDGDPATVDNYYASRNIVAVGFSGTVAGESKDTTFITVGRRSPGHGFSPAYHPFWGTIVDPNTGEPYYYPIIPTALQLDDSTGLVVIERFTLQVVDPKPTDLIPDYYGDRSVAIGTLIDIQAGDNSTILRNVRLRGAVSSAPGNFNGRNVAYGFHDMDYLGERRKELLVIEDVDVETIGGDAIDAMDFESARIEGLIAKDVAYGVFAFRITDLSARGNTIEGAAGISLNDSSGTIANNTIVARNRGVVFNRAPGAIAEHNRISAERIGLLVNQSPRAIVRDNAVDVRRSEAVAWYIADQFSPSTVIADNSFTGDVSYGVNAYLSHGTLIQGNTFTDSRSDWGQVLIESDGCTVAANVLSNSSGWLSAGIAVFSSESGENTISRNTFVNVRSDLSFGAVLDAWGGNNTIQGNDYSRSGLPGWDIGEGAVHLRFTSGDHVAESNSPTGMSFPLGTSLCSQIWDNGTGSDISGFASCESNSHHQEIVDNLAEQLAAHRASMPTIRKGAL